MSLRGVSLKLMVLDCVRKNLLFFDNGKVFEEWEEMEYEYRLKDGCCRFVEVWVLVFLI